MMNWLVRYAPVVRFVKRIGTTDVLEVGSGSWGLADFVDFPVTGCDLRFDACLSERLRPIVGSILDLPFDDAQFECVVCLDTLEHLSPDQRERAIQELVRVTRTYLVVGCPMGKAAHTVDRMLYRNYQLSPGGVPSWLREHMQHPFPRKQDIAHLLGEEGVRYRNQKNENIWMHYALMCAEMAPGLVQMLNALSRMRLVQQYWPSGSLGIAYRTIFFGERMIGEHNER